MKTELKETPDRNFINLLEHWVMERRAIIRDARAIIDIGKHNGYAGILSSAEGELLDSLHEQRGDLVLNARSGDFEVFVTIYDGRPGYRELFEKKFPLKSTVWSYNNH